VIVLVSDLSTVGEWTDALAAWPGRARTPVVAYVPVERGPLHPAHVRAAAAADLLLCYTEFGANELRKGAARERERNPELALPDMEVIPHGVDAALFRPVRGERSDDRGPARRRIFGDDALRHAFIVLNANRNQLRKRVDVTIKGFSLFAEGKPDDVLLYLHMGRTDVGWDVLELARRFGIEERLVMSGKGDGLPNLSGEKVNAVYNACDVGVSTASGEGWGLVAFEHAATGAAQVVPAHSAPAELWRGAAELLETNGTLTNPDNLEEDWIVRPETLAAALERLYADRDYLREMSRRAYENATRPEYAWDAVAERWHRTLTRALAIRG
jgi:glycosyltransferase involved in cell wall biosynthesis